MKQTSVEWLVDRLNKNGLGLTLEEIQQAKEMEKAGKIKAQIDYIINEMDSINYDIRKIYIDELEQQLKKLTPNPGKDE